MTEQREQEGIFTQHSPNSFVLKVNDKGWSLTSDYDWNEFVKYKSSLWEWDDFDNKLLDTLKVPAEYLT